jgi:hypothetical protein
MNYKFPFSYCLLQYRHNPWLKERMNIGVLLYCPDASFLKLNVRGWDGRIKAAYPDLNKSAFTEDLKQIRRSLDRFEISSIRNADMIERGIREELSSQKGNPARHIAYLVAPGGDSSYAWVDGGTGICNSPEDKLNSLYQRFVSPYDLPKAPSARSDDQVWSDISRIIASRKLSDKIETDPTVKTDLGTIKFQAGYQNGAFHAIQSLSFDLKDEDRISAKAGKWSGFAHAVKDANLKRETVTQFILGKPTVNRLLPAYRDARRYLSNVVGQENVVEESEGIQFVDRLEHDILSH